MAGYDTWKADQGDPFADDDRPEESQTCRVCGALEDEDCTRECACETCDFARDTEAEQRHTARVEDGETFRGGDAAAFERDVQAVIYRTLK